MVDIESTSQGEVNKLISNGTEVEGNQLSDTIADFELPQRVAENAEVNKMTANNLRFNNDSGYL